MNPACKDCRFWTQTIIDGKPFLMDDWNNPALNHTMGHCHRFPEMISKRQTNWCGEFQPKEPPPEPGFAPLDFGHMPEDMARHIAQNKLLY